ncbi:MAG: acyltransferase [Clostridia bacterium]|nr:acyltransferase [Clostridia bacterium]
MSKKNEITLLNVLFCLIVIFIHVSSPAISGLNKGSVQYAAVYFPWRLSSFVVQGFVMLSGIKLFLAKKQSYRDFCALRLKRVVLPYIAWVIIYYVYFWCNDYFSFDAKELAKHILRGDLAGHFYFIVAIVQFYALMPIWRAMVRRIHPIVAISSSIIIMIILGQYLPDIISFAHPGVVFEYNDRIFTSYLGYWVIGCYIGENYAVYEKILKESKVFFAFMFFSSAACDSFLSYLSSVYGKIMPYLEGIHILYVFSTILFLYTLAFEVSERILNFKLIKAIDNASYSIYLSHCLAIAIINDWFSKHFITDMGLTYFLRFVFVYTATLSFCTAFGRLTKIRIEKRRIEKNF